MNVEPEYIHKRHEQFWSAKPSEEAAEEPAEEPAEESSEGGDE
jgi:hypothetical protein